MVFEVKKEMVSPLFHLDTFENKSIVKPLSPFPSKVDGAENLVL